MSALRVSGLTVQRGRFSLGPIELEIGDGQTMALLGPSGSGKTTLLETLAGFHAHAAGAVRLGEHDLTRLPPERRRLALVVQDYALFPHLTVGENVAFGLRYYHLPERRVEEVLSVLGILPLLKRSTQALSGGERQRVALARALVTEPAALLLDEPLAALDASTRTLVRTELKQILDALGTTCLFVTHDQADAFALADQVALLISGRIRQAGKPEEVYRRPTDRQVAELLGMQIVPVEPADPFSRSVLVCRPEDVQLSASHGGPLNGLAGVLVGLTPEGPLTRAWVRLSGGREIAALLTRREVRSLDAGIGQQVFCWIDPQDLWPVPDDPAC